MTPPGTLEADVIVVGTGPGGATVARELARRGKSVVILEWGPGGQVRGNLRQYVSELLVPGKSLLVTPELVGMVRGLTTGGSSLFYYATCFPVPFDMFARHGVDLRDEVAEARNELPIAHLCDAMLTPMASRLMDSARQLGFDWRRLDKLMYQERWKPGLPFGYAGDPHGVKWSARMFAEDAVEHGAVMRNGARVTRVLLENGRATGVEYVEAGQTKHAFAGTVVLAAGGIGTPVILRKTGLREAGFDFFFDPLLSVAGTMRDVRTRADEIPMSAGVHLADDGYMMTDMHLSPFTHFLFTAQAFKLRRLFAFRSTARIMIKARDTLGGRLTDSGGVRKKLVREDRARLMLGFENAKMILENAGARDIYKTWILAAHPGGTVKLGELVDANLKTSFDGLYVCDCSVIPEAWGLPPALTLVALGKYLARYLLRQDGPAEAPPDRVDAVGRGLHTGNTSG